MSEYQSIYNALFNYKTIFDQEELIPAKTPEAVQLIHNNSFAFISACCLDRGTKADIIWTIPYWLYQQVGHYDPLRFSQLSLDQISKLFDRLPQKPRYTNAAPRTFQDICRIVVDDFDGVAENIWKNRRAMDVKGTLLSVFGVGNGIANMSLILIEGLFHITFSDLDYAHMDIKPDTHTMRVLYRLGVSTAINEKEAIIAARQLNPAYPGVIDGPLWTIGRNWCYATNPNCERCPMITCCERIGL